MKSFLPLILFAAAQLPALCSAESKTASQATSARLGFSVVVPSVFRILSVTPRDGGYEYRVWTNMKSVSIGDGHYRFDRVGKSTVLVPVLREVHIVHGL